MIDYFLSYNSALAAKRAYDELCTALGLPIGNDYRRQSTISNVKVWRVSEDTTETIGNPPVERVVHEYLPGYWILIAAEGFHLAMLDDKALEFALNRDACNRGEPYIVVNNVGDEISDYAHEPTFAGSGYPAGGYH